MVSRRILVGLVAALGLSVLGWQKIENGFCAFHFWMIARLAEWDSWRPGEKDGVLVSQWPDSSPFEVSEAAPRVDRSTVQPIAHEVRPEASGRDGRGRTLSESGDTESVVSVRPTFPGPIAFEPISGDDELDSGVDAALNRLTDGATLGPPLPEGRGPRSDRLALDEDLSVEAGDWVSSHEEASLELRLALELWRFADGVGSDSSIPSPSTRPRPVLAASNPVDDLFEENPEGYEPAEEDSASSMSSRPSSTMAGASVEPVEAFENVETLLDEWNGCDDGLGIAQESQPAPPVAPRGFEPIVVAGDLDQVIAYQLNRACEGIDLRPPEAGRDLGRNTVHSSSDEINAIARQPEARSALDLSTRSGVAHRPTAPCTEESTGSPCHDELGRAIALTRDAACAWMDVLAGTTSVRVTSR